MHLLIADDDSVSRMVLETVLRKFGHEVTSVLDGEQALNTLCQENAPRLAILDWMMPGLDGLDVCRRLRERRGPYVYVILLTARSEREDMLAAFDGDVDDFLAKPFDMLELRARLQSGGRVIELQEHLLQAQDELRRIARHDYLTGVLSRRAVAECLQQEISRSNRGKTSLSILMLDLDGFKQVNDKYGHLEGDRVLSKTAQGIQAALRVQDAVGRFGGDEFLVVLPDCDAAAAIEVASRLRARVTRCIAELEGVRLEVSVSVGAATNYPDRVSADELVANADDALYRAKRMGRDGSIAFVHAKDHSPRGVDRTEAVNDIETPRMK
jgi:diguanylate cyclase (GGDEF)-like protein